MIEVLRIDATDIKLVSPVNSLPTQMIIINTFFVLKKKKGEAYLYLHIIPKGLNLFSQSFTLSLHKLLVGAIYMTLELSP